MVFQTPFSKAVVPPPGKKDGYPSGGPAVQGGREASPVGHSEVQFADVAGAPGKEGGKITVTEMPGSGGHEKLF